MQPVERDMRILIDGKFSMSQQCTLIAKRASLILEGIKYSTAKQWKEVIVPQYSALMQPQLKYCVQFCDPQYKNNIEILEHV